MKAIYEIQFLTKTDPAVVMDLRRVAGEASTKGFKRILAWAEGVCDKEEFVGAVRLLTAEKL